MNVRIYVHMYVCISKHLHTNIHIPTHTETHTPRNTFGAFSTLCHPAGNPTPKASHRHMLITLSFIGTHKHTHMYTQ